MVVKDRYLHIPPGAHSEGRCVCVEGECVCVCGGVQFTLPNGI